MSILLRSVIAAGLLAGVVAVANFVTEPSTEGRAIAFSLIVGAVFGIVLQRSRFCFFCHFRDFVERRDPRGVLAIVVALAVGAVLYQVVVSAWMPVVRDTLPPNAHIGPVSWVLALAAFAFGVGMAISGSCLSAHLYRLGEGSPTSPFALVGALAGFVAGFLSWNALYLAAIAEAPATWLPHSLGYGGALALALVVLGVLAVLILAWARPVEAAPAPGYDLSSVSRRIFIDRWPALLGGAAVGVISALAYFRVAPLGVTAELGSIARTGGFSAGLLPETLHGLDLLRGCATAVKTALVSRNGAFVAALVVGSFAAALVAGQFRPQWPTGGQVLRGLAGGFLMGWGAMIGLGCTVGVLLSGIHVGALSGWVFLVFVTLGVWTTLFAQRRAAAAGRRQAAR